jgi:hypothetical protein
MIIIAVQIIDICINVFYFLKNNLQTKPDLLTADCLKSLPVKEKSEKKKLSSAEKLKADKRKKIRNKAAKMARGEDL